MDELKAKSDVFPPLLTVTFISLLLLVYRISRLILRFTTQITTGTYSTPSVSPPSMPGKNVILPKATALTQSEKRNIN